MLSQRIVGGSHENWQIASVGAGASPKSPFAALSHEQTFTHSRESASCKDAATALSHVQVIAFMILQAGSVISQFVIGKQYMKTG